MRIQPDMQFYKVKYNGMGEHRDERNNSSDEATMGTMCGGHLRRNLDR